MATLSLRRLWTIYKQTAVDPRSSKRNLARTQLAFYSGARGVLKVLAFLIEHGDYEELHQTIKRHGRQIERIRYRRPRARRH
jgi:endonuclease III